jgi:hypothetical protein
MDSQTRGTGRMIAIFGAIPVVIIITLGAWFILMAANNGAALNLGQALTAIFVGLAVGALFFAGICMTQRNCG